MSKVSQIGQFELFFDEAILKMDEVTNSSFNVSIIDYTYAEYTYNWTIQSRTSQSLLIQLHFDSPIYVSSGAVTSFNLTSHSFRKTTWL